METWQEDIETFMAGQQQERAVREQRREEARREAVTFLETAVAPVFTTVSNYLMGRFGREVKVYNRSQHAIDQAEVVIDIGNEGEVELRYAISVGFDNQQAFPIALAESAVADMSEMPDAAFADSEHGSNVTEVTQDDVRADLLRHYKYAVTKRQDAITGWDEPTDEPPLSLSLDQFALRRVPTRW